MFCKECGTRIEDDSKFCMSCGIKMPGDAQGPVQPYQAAPPQDEQGERKKGGFAGFLSSPAGIVVIVILAIAVIGGLTVGLIFGLKSGPNSTVDADTVKVWDEYESVMEDDSANIPKITMDQASLAKSREELKQSQEKLAALQKALKETGGTEQRRSGASASASTRDIKADQLAEALKAYAKYIEKLSELTTALTGANLLDPNTVNNINRILAELQDLGATVKVTANKFLADNAQVVTVSIDPPILKLPKATAAEIQASVTAAQNAEQQRLAGEKAAADAEAERQKQAQKEQQKTDLSRCPRCGASDPSVWLDTRGGYHCLNCGYIYHDPNAQ